MAHLIRIKRMGNGNYQTWPASRFFNYFHEPSNILDDLRYLILYYLPEGITARIQYNLLTGECVELRSGTSIRLGTVDDLRKKSSATLV